MATNRTIGRWMRLYMDGYDISGYTLNIGEMGAEYEVEPKATLTEELKGILPGKENISFGPVNGVFDSTASSGLHAIAKDANALRTILTACGFGAEPVVGDPAFIGKFQQLDYKGEPGAAGLTTANIVFGSDSPVTDFNYENPWAYLLHPKAARTAVNSAAGVDDYEAASAFGLYMVYQIFAVEGTGSVVIKLEEASTNTDVNFADLTDATSGAIAHTAVPAAGLIQIGKTDAVKQYLRWQIVLTGITSVTFALAFVRATR